MLQLQALTDELAGALAGPGSGPPMALKERLVQFHGSCIMLMHWCVRRACAVLVRCDVRARACVGAPRPCFELRSQPLLPCEPPLSHAAAAVPRRSLLNYAAVAKILKKHDKRTGLLLRAPCLTNVLQQARARGAWGGGGRGAGALRAAAAGCAQWRAPASVAWPNRPPLCLPAPQPFNSTSVMSRLVKAAEEQLQKCMTAPQVGHCCGGGGEVVRWC